MICFVVCGPSRHGHWSVSPILNMSMHMASKTIMASSESEDDHLLSSIQLVVRIINVVVWMLFMPFFLLLSLYDCLFLLETSSEVNLFSLPSFLGKSAVSFPYISSTIILLTFDIN